MAKFLVFVLVLLVSSQSFSQWTSLNPYPTSNGTYIGAAPSANKYITVTDYTGEAVMTTDGGNTWHVIFIGYDGVFRRTFFLNDNLGWAVGAGVECLYKTTDGGFNWTYLSGAPDTTKYDVYFINENVGWTVGYYGFINKTTDGGLTWFSQSNTGITTSTLYSVFALDANTVFVSGNDQSSLDVLLKSTDGGATWMRGTSNIFSASTDLRGIEFSADGSVGVVVGYASRIAKTTDRGVTWTSVYAPGGTSQLWDVTFNSSGVGLASGGSSKVYRTTDWGTTWTAVTGITSSVTLYSVEFASENIVYLSGSSGYFYKSTDAGATFQTMGRRSEGFSSLKGFAMANNLIGYAVGTTGKIFKTTDGGLTYFPQTSAYTATIYEVVALTPEVVFASGQDGTVLRTTNGGTLWDTIIVAGNTIDFVGCDFLSPTTGYVAGTNGSVYYTNDGGESWKNVSIPGSTVLLWDVDFVDELTGFIVGTGGKVFCTKNGGSTWTEQLSAGGLGLYGVSFVNSMVGVAGGSSGTGPFYTTDGGTTWNTTTTPPTNTIWSIKIVDSPVGPIAYAACASGNIYISDDLGATWRPAQRLTISTFEDIGITDAGHVWFAAGSGVIIGYHNPAYYPVELMSLTASVNGKDVTLSWTTATELNNSGFEIQRRSETIDWQKIGFVNGKINSTEFNNYQFTDMSLAYGKYNYRIKQIDVNGTFEYFNIENTIDISVPNTLSLEQNYPNPFNPATTINFNVPVKSEVTLKVYNLLGKEVANLMNEVKEPGNYNVNFNASDLASGVYFYELRAGSNVITKKMTLMK